MKKRVVLTINDKQTKKLAKVFVKSLKKNTIIFLNGDLGAGKTTFAKGIAKGLRIRGEITSPTFTILNQYENKRARLFHFDMYRLSSANELMEAGLAEYLYLNNFTDKKTICVVEWGENVIGAIPKSQNIVNIQIEKIDDNTRKFIFND